MWVYALADRLLQHRWLTLPIVWLFILLIAGYMVWRGWDVWTCEEQGGHLSKVGRRTTCIGD